MRVEKIDIMPEWSNRRKGTPRGGSVSITFSADMLQHAHLAGLTDFEVVPADGGGLFIRAPRLVSAEDFKPEPVAAEHEASAGAVSEDGEGLF